MPAVRADVLKNPSTDTRGLRVLIELWWPASITL
jgi:hypothetical protein